MADVKIFDKGRRTQLISPGPPTPGNTDFNFLFLIFEAGDLDVFQTPAGQKPNEVADRLTINIDYTIPVDSVNNEVGGKIVLVVPAPENDIITLQSATDKTQLVDFKVGGQFAPETINFVIDKLTVLVQENNSLITKLGLTYSTVDELQPKPDFGDNALPVLPVRSGEIFPVWTKNTNNKLIAGELKEESGCSTLRGELLDESVLTPGAEIVGYFNAFEPPTGVSETVNDALNKLFQKLVPVVTHTIGDVKPSFSNIASTGWIRMNDDTIGDAASGATARANADTKDLFILLWNNVSNDFAPVLPAPRGATALDDFNADKTLRFPLIKGRVPGGTGQGAGLPSLRTLGEDVGVETHQLTIDELATHDHKTSFTGTEDFSAGSGFTAHKASTVPVLVTQPTGGNAPHPNVQPTMFMNWYIRFTL